MGMDQMIVPLHKISTRISYWCLPFQSYSSLSLSFKNCALLIQLFASVHSLSFSLPFLGVIIIILVTFIH